MKSNQTLVIDASDHHTNSTVGLCPPVVHLDDGGTYHASRGQRWLWECWLDMWATIRRDYSGWRIVYIIGGDVGELDTKRRSYQLISPNKATIQAMVSEAQAPALDLADAVYVIRGTPAHTGKSAWLEEATAQDITTNVRNKEAHSWYWLRATASGVRFDVGHHSSMGGIPWTAPNSANRLAFLAMNYYHENELPVPHVILRSHNHRYATSADNFKASAYFTPAWTLRTEYIHQGKEYGIAQIGAMAFECDGGRYVPRKFDYPIRESRRLWAVQL